MERLNLPEYSFKIRNRGGRIFIFDSFRKKEILLTPEEWVRQNFLQYMVSEKGFPASLISVEMSFRLNKLVKRGDIVAFGRGGKPLLLVECKASSVSISQNTFDQIARYNMSLKVDYLIVTNGLQHFCCKMDFKNKTYGFLKSIPSFQQIGG